MKTKTKMSRRDKLQVRHPDTQLLFLSEKEFDKAIVRITTRKDRFSGKICKVVAYSTAKCIEAIEEMGMTYDEAVEWFYHNTAGAYFGPQTPYFIGR